MSKIKIGIIGTGYIGGIARAALRAQMNGPKFTPFMISTGKTEGTARKTGAKFVWKTANR